MHQIPSSFPDPKRFQLLVLISYDIVFLFVKSAHGSHKGASIVLHLSLLNATSQWPPKDRKSGLAVLRASKSSHSDIISLSPPYISAS